jgi:hypothetical protein
MLSEVTCRWLAFVGALGLSLAPALLGLTVLPQLIDSPRLFNAALVWYFAALSPAGIARVDFDGAIWLADSAWLLSLGGWAVVGFAFAFALRRLKTGHFLALVFPLQLATGFAVQLLLHALGLASYASI